MIDNGECPAGTAQPVRASDLHDPAPVGELAPGEAPDSAGRNCAEAALRESHEIFSLFMRHSPIYSFIKEVTPTESRVLQASDNYQQMVGIRGTDMVGKTMAELFPADMAAKMTADDWAVASSGRVLTLDEDLNGRNYTTIKFPIIQGGRTLLAGYTIDITERKRAEDAVRSERKRFFDLLEALPAFVYLLAPDHSIRFANAYYRTQFGDPQGQTCYSSLRGRKEPCEDCRTFRFFDSPEPREWVWDDAPNGRTYHIIHYPFTDSDGSSTVLELGIDITERRRAEEERETLRAQLNQAQKMESVGRLAGGVAHDFNNMLAVILGNVELALTEVDPAQPLHANLMEIRKAASRSADLTRQLLGFARRQLIVPAVLDLNETVGVMLSMLRRLIGEDIELVWRPSTQAWRAKIDPSQVDQILANLCVNARDAIKGVGRITIATENATFDDAHCAKHPGHVPGQYVRLSVSDDGCGMDQETLSHLFEPFFTTKAIGRGTGLGLATVYGMVTQNHGFITARSDLGVGTTFAVYLPRHADEGEPASPAAAVPRMGGGQETVLVVEDDAAVLNMTAQMLAGQGYTVLSAHSPGEAIRVAADHADAIHLLMTDVIMPGMNGWDLAAKLLSRYPHLKCLFTSGYTADVIADHGVLDEGVHFLQKPFSLADVTAKVREALDEE